MFWLAALLVATLTTALAQGQPVRDILVGTVPVELTLTAPLQALVDERPSGDDDRTVEGQMTWRLEGRTGAIAPVRVSLRGHTSRQQSECSFPKLKLDLSRADRDGTPFDQVPTLKLGTHCGDAADDQLTRRYGRLASPLAPPREALVYAMLDAAGVPTLRARPATVTYAFTGEPARAALTRPAMLLEDDDAAQRRLEGGDPVDEDTFGAASAQLRPRDTALLAFGEAMIGNFDWCLRMFPGDVYRCDDRHPLWNVLAFTRPDGMLLPVIYDFDLSGPVVGRHVWFRQTFDAAFVDPPSELAVEVIAQVQRTRSLFDRRLLDDTRAHFRARRQAVDDVIARGRVDPRGRALARAYADAFFAAIDSDAAFYRPVVTMAGVEPFRDAAGTEAACPTRRPIPVGTPVGPPLERRGALQQVRLLDALWAWTGDDRCDAVHHERVWIRTDAVGTDYPR